MKKLVLVVLMAVLAWGSAQSYDLSVYVNEQELSWQEDSLNEGMLTVSFEGGKLELNLIDWGDFNYAHVLGTEFRRTNTDTYTVSTVVRHNDTGWDNYADAFEVNTRSQSSVKATGEVWVEAKDNVEGSGGSVIHVDLAVFEGLPSVHLTYDLKVKNQWGGSNSTPIEFGFVENMSGVRCSA